VGTFEDDDEAVLGAEQDSSLTIDVDVDGGSHSEITDRSVTDVASAEDLGELPPQVLFTTYGVLRQDVALLQHRIWGYVIIDEAQTIKNPASSTSRTVKSLKKLNALALSGTPIENRLLEMYSIFDFLMPDFLARSAKEFVEEWEKPIATWGDPQVLKSLQTRVQPFILRRLKEDVAEDLPPKTDIILKCDLSPRQQLLYKNARDACWKELQTDIIQKGSMAAAQMSILAALMKLRQICDDPRLVDPSGSVAARLLASSKTLTPTPTSSPTISNSNSDESDEEEEDIDIEVMLSAVPYMHSDSAKLTLLYDLLADAIQGGHRVLIFSQFVGMLSLLRGFLHEHGYGYEYLDGKVPPATRLERVKRFNEDTSIPVFLISLKAGGTGLNLTGADYVIHYDAWWNPAVEAQATDRAHRIGQRRAVFNYKMITRNTIEERVLDLQKAKSRLADTILSSTSDSQVINNLTLGDLEYLFKD